MRLATLSACLIFTLLLVTPLRADGVSVSFRNTTAVEINDIEIVFNHPVTGHHWIDNGPTPSTQFPNATGFGTSVIVLSGAPVENPGQTSYSFDSAEENLEVESADWTFSGEEGMEKVGDDPVIVYL